MSARRTTKAQRQHLIASLIEARSVHNQAQLVELLDEAEVKATQATVSRDLDDLGALKVRVPGGESVYAIPELAQQRSVPHDQLRRVLGDWVVAVSSSANLVVVRTPPGSAHVVGSVVDRSRLDAVLGTVAGDDTVIIVATAEVGGDAVAEQLRELAGL